jgi:putative ABC transport system permease protein
LPYSDAAWADDCEIQNRPLIPGKFRNALRMNVSQGFFNAVHVPMVSGRVFLPSDSLDAQPVAIVSRTFVARYFSGENPIGHKIRMGAARASHEPWMTIVGIAEDTRYSWWDQAPPATVYMSVAQIPPPVAFYALVTDGDPLALAPAARKAMAGLDPALPLDDVQTYDQILRLSLTGLIYAAAYLGIDALIALLLAAIGIFAVMANLVGERTREIGVRLAMGARREDVLGMILRRAAWLTGTGVVAGLVMAFGLARMTANLLAGVRPDDPLVFTSITAVIAAIALWSSWIPARRASRIDPMVALRDE